MTVQKANHRHLRATVRAAKTIGFASISFLAADLTSEAFNRALVWPGERQSEIALTEKEVAGLEDEIEQLIVEHGDDIRRGYIVEAAAKLRRIPRRFREHLGQATPNRLSAMLPGFLPSWKSTDRLGRAFSIVQLVTLAHATLEEVVNGEAARLFRDHSA